ncbi:hypothetical protein B0T14DRAFT_570330 [Immersiella caudata]|uniref:Uncharacterized protein n=1 Tax=Immersiella caudata TaxID=314043 RepID=A0AA40BUR5_9PEZI|nr:hypothetical protein B0T14DRAFT_570330 [Immersiella caudata]
MAFPQEYTPLGTEQYGSDGDPKVDSTHHDGPAKESAARGETWRTGFWRRLPMLALLSALCTLLSTVACAVALRASDGANTEDWQVAPSVLVSIFTAFGNAALRLALAEGFQMAWWTRVTEKPRTITRLHEYYQHGTSALSAGLSLRHPSFIGVASLLVTILAIDGPLLQRASSTALVVRSANATPVAMTLGKELPYGFTGVVFSHHGRDTASRSLLSEDFTAVFDDYSQRRPILATHTLGSGCRGICEGEIEASGLWKTCNSSEENVVTPLMNETQARRALLNRTLFGVEWKHVTRTPPFITVDVGQTPINGARNPDNIPYVILNITYSPPPANGSRSIFTHTCRLYSGTSRYPIRINNDTAQGSSGIVPNAITLTGSSVFIPGTMQDVFDSVASLNLAPTVEGPDPSQPYRLSLNIDPYFFRHPTCIRDDCPIFETLGGLASAMEGMLSARAFISGSHMSYLTTIMTGALSNQLVRSLSIGGVATFRKTDNGRDITGDPFMDGVGWDDPTDQIVQALDEVMFRTAVATSQTDVLRNVSWMYANRHFDRVDAPPRNGSDADKYRIMPAQQQILMRQTYTIQVFRSNYAFLAGGIAVMVIATLGVLPLFYGFWTLGRSMSLSPVETAKAFGAPMLEGSGGRVTADGIAESEVGRMKSKARTVDSELKSADSMEQAKINLNLFADELDIVAMREGLGWIIGEDYPWAMPRDSDEAMGRMILERAQTGFHYIKAAYPDLYLV